ncbi:MAG: site-specific integrase [Deltaproteobacteria bacterium]|nr:site-specific integrase [Deltaproteobacteria bacterium]
MGSKKRVRTRHTGVFYREHDSRQYNGRNDRYYLIRYRFQGRQVEEGIGWASRGWNEIKARNLLATLREAHKTGKGPRTLAEQREVAEAEREALEAERTEQERESRTFGQFWRDTYFPNAQQEKTQRTAQREASFFKKWLGPTLANKPLSHISPIDLERVKKAMVDAGSAPRSVQYMLAVCRQVFHHARDRGIFHGEPPTTKVSKPKFDNARIRFLTHEEAGRLLDSLGKVSADLHDQALLSLHCGLRAGEIFGLAWGDVDLERKQLTLRDTKNSQTRVTFMTTQVQEMLNSRKRGGPEELVFPAVGGGRRKQISVAFGKVVNSLGFNKGITDRRNRVTFHTLRHTFASWLVQGGQPLYSVQQLLGHKTPAMTSRYSHLAPDHLRGAVKTIEATASGSRSKVVLLED